MVSSFLWLAKPSDMSLLASKSQIMDDLIFHELWLAKQKFRNFDSNDDVATPYSTSSEAEQYDSDETENESDFKDLFKKDREADLKKCLVKKKKKNKYRSVVGNRNSEWATALLGIFFVAAVAGVASYRAYSNDASDQLNGVKFKLPVQEDNNQVIYTTTIYNFFNASRFWKWSGLKKLQ